MAKKKKKKDETTKSFQYSVELNGLLLILIGLIGFGTFGPVGRLIKNFAIFLMGSWYVIVLLAVLFLGIYMIIKRKMPKMFTNRLIGLYFLILAILIFSHLEYAVANELKGKVILTTTIDNFMGATSSLNSNVGGGIIGALFVVLFTSLLDVTGTKIVIAVLCLFGFILLFDITIADIFQKIKEITAKHKEKSKEHKINKLAAKGNEQDCNEEENDNDDKVVITSVEELKTNSVDSSSDQVDVSTPNVAVNTNYILPSIDLLENPKKPSGKVTSNDFIKSNKMVLERVLSDFGIKGTVVEIHVGPAVTQFEVSVSSGTKINRIKSLDKEIALALAAKSVAIEAPIPGKNTVGVEIPNPSISAVKIKEVLGNVPANQQKGKIVVALGKDLMGHVQTADISRMPHLLVAGATGSGKSVCMNSIIASILMRYRPDEVKLVLVDPKKVEMSNYNGIPHLLWPVVTDPKKASVALQKIVDMMDDRYLKFMDANVKKIEEFNSVAAKKGLDKMPYIVVIIDELADLMMVASKEVEGSIQRITQLARAAGIHLIVATQRPSTNVITGVIKANIPSRIAFSVASSIDSRTILDSGGAEKLLGKGDMLYKPMDENNPLRIQGCFITDEETQKLIDHVCNQQKVMYDTTLEQTTTDDHNPVSNEKEEYDDPLYNEIVEFAISTGKISASLLQRRFRLGYNRAARIVDLLEERGIVGPQNGSKPREVLVKLEEKE